MLDLNHKLKCILATIFYIPGKLFLALDSDRTSLIGIGKAEGTNDFTIFFTPFINNSVEHMSSDLKCKLCMYKYNAILNKLILNLKELKIIIWFIIVPI